MVGVMPVLSAAIVIFTGDLATIVGDKIGLGSAAVLTWSIVKWPVLLMLVSLMFAILYWASLYWASPNAKTGGFRWVSPGGIFAVLLWILASGAFAIYLANFADYNATYGAVGGVIAFLVWMRRRTRRPSPPGQPATGARPGPAAPLRGSAAVPARTG